MKIEFRLWIWNREDVLGKAVEMALVPRHNERVRFGKMNGRVESVLYDVDAGTVHVELRPDYQTEMPDWLAEGFVKETT